MIISTIKKIISTVCKAFYAVISLLNLQLTLFVAVIGLLLYLTGVLTDDSIAKTVMIVLVALSVIYAIIATVYKIFGLGKKKTTRQKPEKVMVKAESQEQTRVEEPIKIVESKPRYYKVKQNQDLIMAEYDDRYELFEVVNGRMKKIRTDYK